MPLVSENHVPYETIAAISVIFSEFKILRVLETQLLHLARLSFIVKQAILLILLFYLYLINMYIHIYMYIQLC